MMLFDFAITTTIVATVVSASAFAFAFDNNSKNSNLDESDYVSRLMTHAQPTYSSEHELGRALEKSPFVTNLSAFSIRFDHCRKLGSETLQDQGMVPTMTQRSIPALSNKFAIFRLCPSDSCDSCESNFLEYIIDLESYLQETVAYHLDKQEKTCGTCKECTFEKGDDWMEDNGDDGNAFFQNTATGRLADVSVDCENCYNECARIESMEENGYLDATVFIQCQMIYDPEDDGLSRLYAGPLCNDDGSKVKIGVFTDEYCKESASNYNVEDYLMNGDGYAMKLSHALLKKTYSNDCISCIPELEEQQQEEKALEMCYQLYELAERFGDEGVSDSKVTLPATESNEANLSNSGYGKARERNNFAAAVFGIAIVTLLTA